MSNNVRNMYTFKVYHDDTDFSGIMYHGRHIVHCEHARSHFLHTRGLSHQALKEEGLLIVVHALNINYKKPAFLEDTLSIITSIQTMGFASMAFVQKIMKNDTIMIAEALVNVVFLDYQWRVTPIPKQIKRALV